MRIQKGAEKIMNDFSRLDSLIKSCGDDFSEYKFISSPDGSYSQYFGDDKLIAIDERIISSVEFLSKYDRKYLSALKMIVYHEVGHFKNPMPGQPYNIKEIAAELYAIDKCNFEEYITELAVISDNEKDEVSGYKLNPVSASVEYLLRHDSVDKWKDKDFISMLSRYNLPVTALEKYCIQYSELKNRIIEESRKIADIKSRY